MIRINLLGVAKAKRGKRPAVAAPVAISAEGVNPLLIALIVLIVTAAANGGYWWKLNHDAQKIASEMRKAEQENRELLQVKARVDQKNRQADAYQRRVQVIDKLREAQAGPKALLNMLGDTISSTDAVWLSKVNDDGGAITMQGTALSANAVANLIANLQKTGYFKSVEMKETYQDDAVRNMQAFTFNLVCEKKS